VRKGDLRAVPTMMCGARLDGGHGAKSAPLPITLRYALTPARTHGGDSSYLVTDAL
jgi:hypothetical protein